MKRLTPVFLLCISPSLSAEESMNELLSMSLDELMQVEITSSTLTPESLKTVPSAVSVYTHEEIKRLGLDVLGELMNLVPGFQSYRSSGSSLETPFSSRGRRIGTTTAEILVLIDGLRFDSPRSSGSSILAPNYPLKYIEKVEFIRGPGAAIYGSNAMMGIINITTRSNVNEVSVAYGSYNRQQIYLQTSQKFSGVNVDFFAHTEKDDGESFNVIDTFNSPTRTNTDDPRKLTDLNLKFNWENTNLNFSYNEFEVKNFYELNNISNDFNSRDGQIASISLTHKLNWQAVESTFNLSFNHVNATVNGQLTPARQLAPISAPTSNEPLFVSANFKKYTETRALWHNNWTINEQSNLQFGFEVRHIDAPEAIASNNYDLAALSDKQFPIDYYGSLLPTTPVQTESARRIVGVYTQYQQQLLESTRLTLGLRYDQFSGIDAQISPRIGLVQEINQHHSVKLLYGEAFRAPSESELNLLNNPFLLGNPDLEPETVKSLDLIWVGQWVHTGVSLGYFENRFDNSIVATDIGSGTFQYMNKNQDPSKGYELEISHELNQHWLIRGNATFLNQLPELSFREAQHFASVTINYQQVNWNANLIAQHVDARKMEYGNQIIELDQYTLLTGKFQYNINENLMAFIQAKNLLDENYLTPSIGSNINEGIPNRGRELLTGVSWKF